MSKKAVHVVPSGGSWKVKTAGAERAAKVTGNQAEAIQKGIQMAKNSRTELIVHRSDGTIRSKDSYGKDPFPPRDREH